MEPEPFTAVARAVKTHGVAGELSCTPLEGALGELPIGLELWFVPPPDGPLMVRLEGVRPGPKGTIIKVSSIDTVEQARALTSRLLLAKTEDLPEDWIQPEEFDAVGLLVRDVERGELGTVEDVIVTGANDVWVVRGPEFGEVLLPAIDDVILKIDDEALIAEVRLLPGLLDEE